MKQKVFYHGSPFKINGFLELRKARDTSKEANCQFVVYATDKFDIAKSMSMKGESPAFSVYEKDSRIIFMSNAPTPEREVYVYEVPAESFMETVEKHQFISKVKVPILNSHSFKIKNLKDYWRFATEEEFNQRWKKMGYPSPYKEFMGMRERKINLPE